MVNNALLVTKDKSTYEAVEMTHNAAGGTITEGTITTITQNVAVRVLLSVI